MSPEERELLNRSVSLAEENNKILLSVKRSMRISKIMTYIYLIFIIGSAAGAYYLLQPYIDQLIGIYGNVQGTFDNIKQFSQ
ncbi:hypothetical protein A2641_02575 [Candidatus Nomurabacteria bacterium RIFCSPHIGHO2_01_FULL_37_25]|uniref:Uncharacterized protein n=1 Tax=Candidatus Nomurabacteria bacterium RIFCSPLOWO2_01_FULL_36_16 TaxID=1801767 RepID=A0A1F6X092_9BACT|nr:MAG: hypothetical protein A2641_02575 [Candidatus Nomurabacteria bacterium RIFCSPHIGHO2_01_FULL_37_25]OGI75039.1 MAG: hypothetical protein A3D36_03320 [Candidatus Nomurabacteria bacterium RIFCSPHIGHO2_02_FULL_36_29]OGI87550.1 MAG: hypothetical protein A3A91_01390 [Candidatus Nomurabacteria bacterium RIFCSPLOWO2_01_FULL_36_16]